MPDSPSAGRDLTIERVFSKPIDLVWKMWTESERFAAWYGPDGATVPIAELDARVGGRRFVAMEMQTPDGPMRMHFAGEHVEVDEPNRLVYSEAMADEHGDALSAEQTGRPPGAPSTTRVIVKLSEIGAGTHLLMTHAGVPADSPGAAGWAMALAKLEAQLADS